MEAVQSQLAAHIQVVNTVSVELNKASDKRLLIRKSNRAVVNSTLQKRHTICHATGLHLIVLQRLQLYLNLIFAALSQLLAVDKDIFSALQHCLSLNDATLFYVDAFPPHRILVRLMQSTQKFISLLAQAQRAESPDIFQFGNLLTHVDAQEWWMKSFGSCATIARHSFLVAFYEYLMDLYGYGRLHRNFKASLALVLDLTCGVGEWFSVKDFNTFLFSWGPMAYSLDKLLCVFNALGMLQPWLVNDPIQAIKVAEKYKFAVWIRAPGQFAVLRKGNPLPFTVINDHSNAKGNDEVAFGYHVNNAADQTPYLTLAFAIQPYVGFLPQTGSNERMDPARSDFSESPEEPEETIAKAEQKDDGIVSVNIAARELFVSQAKFIASLPVDHANLPEMTKLLQQLCLSMDEIVEKFGAKQSLATNVTPSGVASTVVAKPIFKSKPGRHKRDSKR